MSFDSLDNLFDCGRTLSGEAAGTSGRGGESPRGSVEGPYSCSSEELRGNEGEVGMFLGVDDGGEESGSREGEEVTRSCGEATCSSKSITDLKVALVKMELEEYQHGYGPLAEIDRVLKAKTRRRRRIRYKRGERPVVYQDGRSSCTEESLNDLRRDFGISEEIDLVVPDEGARADSPPPGFFTMYENFVDRCYLWFPIPEVILDFLARHNACLAQLTPRSIRHLVGLLVRSFECEVALTVEHYQSLLRFSRTPGGDPRIYFLSNRSDRRVIDHFPNKDYAWSNFFFFVPISEASVSRLDVRTSWGSIGQFR